MELRDSGRGRLKDLADVAGHKVAETAKAATQRAVDMARDAEEAAREAAGSAAQFADAAGRMLLDRVGDRQVHTYRDQRAYLSHATPAQRRKRTLAEGLPHTPGVYLFLRLAA